MRGTWKKRTFFLLGTIVNLFFLGMFLKNGYQPGVDTDKDLDTRRMIRSFSNLEASISNLNDALRRFEKKQDAMQKMLEEDSDRHRKSAEVQKQTEKQKEGDVNIQPQNEAAPMKKSEKLFPNSYLFKKWGANLSEDGQREAQSLYEKYGYNVFLSDRLPLDRPLPDTRDPRYNFYFL